MNKPHTDLQQLQAAILKQRLQQRMKSQSAAGQQARIEAADRSKPLALSYAQQRLWFLTELDRAASIAYHIPAQLQLKGRLDRAALKATLARIVARHESLRTRFVDAGGMPVQQIAAPDVGMMLGECDLSHLSGHERACAVQRLSDDEAVQPFDLATGPLIRGQLLRLADDEHVLLITQHHIVSDGWSIGVLVREVSTLYTAFSTGQADPLPPLAIQYADYAAWQRGWLQGDVLQAQSAFWKEQLTGAPALLELPTDRPRPPQQSYAGASIALALDAQLTAGLKALSQKHGATLFMTLLAGWAALLARLSGQDDVVVGTPVANRQRAEVEGLIGFFVNTLALRVRLEDDPTVAQLLAQVKAHTLGAYAHQDLPFEQMVEAVQPARSMSHSPLFQVMLSLDNAPGGDLQLPGLSIRGVQPKHNTAQFDLTLLLTEAGGQLSGSLRYASDLFDAATIARIAGYFTAMLAAMVADDAVAVSRIPLLSAAQRGQLLVEFNDTAQDYPQDKLLHQLFEEQAANNPEATALLFEGQDLGYGELNRRANRLAHHLRSFGLQPDSRVAICMERGIDMVVGLLAILKAGAAYVPLDPGYPVDRLAYMLDDCAPAVLLTQTGVALDAGQVPTVVVDGDDARAIAACADANPDPMGLGATNLAYVIYTSGSTGMPKGAMNEHAAVLNRLQWMQQAFPLGAADRVLQKTPFSFDVSVWEFFWPLMAGATLVIARPGGHKSPEYLAQLIDAMKVTTLHFVPSMLQAFVAERGAWSGATLQRVFCSGEALPPPLSERFLRTWPHIQLHNLYGPTEAAVDVTWHPCGAQGGASIGRPIANTRIYILDRHLQPAPLGVAGEIYIAGVQVGRGYLNRPELTAERFVADPYGDEAHARMYKTGDLGRWTADGAIDYLGRNDFQVKIRGFRIELGEIEARLLQCDGVEAALVMAREDAPGEKRLVAYLRAQPGVAPAGLRAQLGQHLADFMIPAVFVTLDAFPVTANGKLDRKALPAPDQGALARSAYAAPQGALEAALCEAWGAVLKVERVGVDDNYFDIGGDSIRSIAIVAHARKQGIELALVDIFKHLTVRSLAQALASRQGAAAQAEQVEILSEADRALLPAQVEDAYPMTLLQMGMVFHNQLEQDTGLYHDVFSSSVTLPAWDEGVLRRVLAAMAHKHPALRTSFDLSRYSEPLQLVWRQAELPLTVIDLRGVESAGLDRTVAAFVDAERKNNFALASAPLLRIFVHLRGENAIQYTFSFHHAVLDGWSVASFQTEMFNAYFAALEGKDIALAPLAVTPKAAALREKQALRSERHRGFWRGYLDGHVYAALPPAEEVVDATSMDRNRALKVSDAVCTKLQALAAELAVPMRTVLLSAHLRVVSMLAGKGDVTTGLVSNVRPEEQDGEKVLGLFLNTLPLRQQLARGRWKDLVKATYANELALIEHRDYPYFQLHVDNGRNPYYEIVFNFINFHVYDDLKAGPQEDGYKQAFEATGFDLVANFAYSPTKGIECELKPGKLGGAQTERILGYYLAVLEAMAADPDAFHDERHFLAAPEQRRLLVDLNATQADYPRELLVHQLFEAQAGRTPDAIAVVFDAVALTYAQLNARANRLARHLRELGAGPDVLVGICMERSVELVVAMFAVLKAGAAYAPLDPAYPKERLAYMASDARPVVLLTHSHLRERIAVDGVALLCLDEADGVLAGYADHDLAPIAGPNDLIYAIYTSGSTGQPKGTLVHQRGFTNLVSWYIARFGIGAQDKVLLLSSIGFDLTQKNVFAVLLVGGQLHLSSGGYAPERIWNTIRDQGITYINCAPSAFYPLLPYCSAHAPVALRQVFLGGEPIQCQLLHDMLGKLPSPPLIHNTYGPTEASDVVSYFTWDPREARASLPIGRPIANTQMYILDAHRNPLPLGVAGDIYIGGDGVGRGYLHRPELTAERFIADPFSGHAAARLYKTGDVGRWLADGNIDYLGRDDFQVKIRGFRVELGEIESRLAACAGVREAVVVAREEHGQEKRLVAYVVPEAGANLSAAGLRSALADELAEFMVPAAFVMLDALPLTPNGKLDRKALPAPDQAAIARRAYETPIGEVETTLAQIWQGLLGVERVGRRDHFFELGGHSLLGVQLAVRMREKYDVDIPIGRLFDQPVVADLAALVVAAQLALYQAGDLAELDHDLDDLSEEELRAMLSQG
jgi:amino acid adenylation domain-containing protein